MSPATGSAPAAPVTGPVPPAPPVPSARRLRAQLLRARREHTEGRAGDLYLLLMVIVVFGATIPGYLARHLAHRSPQPADVATRWWLVIALAVAAAGLAWLALRALGPLLAMPSAQSWCVASPVDRRGWLVRPLCQLLLAGAVVGAGLGALGGLLAGGATGDPRGAAVAGAALLFAGVGLALTGFAAAVQTRRYRAVERVPAVLGLAGAAALIVARYADLVPAEPATRVLWPALAVVLAAAAATVMALRRLGRVDRAALAAGAPLAGAAASAAIFMDPTLFSGVLEARQWRQAERLRRHGLRPGPRWLVLLRAEVRRLTRRRQALAIWACLLLVPYALVLLAPQYAGAGRLVAGYLAANRLAAGLRAVCRSPALRRSLGGTDRELRLVHLAVPAAGVLVWWLASSGLGGSVPGQVVLVAGLVLAVYRNASAPPVEYGGAVSETPFGLIPVGMLRSILRGLDVVAVLVFLEFLIASVGS